METPRPTVQANDVAPSNFVDLTLAAEPLDLLHESFAAIETPDPHQNTNSTALAAPTWSLRQPSLSPTTSAPRTAIADTNATSQCSLEKEASTGIQGAPSLWTSSVTTSAEKASSITPVTSSSPRTPSGEGDHSSHGPLPQWAYFYEPALTHAQVRYIESQMRPQDEYKKIPPDQRQSVVVKDLQQALSTMRLVYSRSTNVANSTPDGMKHATASPRATATDATSQFADKSAQGFNVEDAILAEQTGSDMVTEDRVSAETLHDNWVSKDPSSKNSYPPNPSSPSRSTSKDTATTQATKFEGIHVATATHSIPPQSPAMTPSPELPLDASPRKSRGQPVYSLARLNGSYMHGKRAASGDHVAPKRQRLESTLVTDENGRASIVSTPYVSRPARSPAIPESPLQTAPTQKSAALTQSELPTEPHPPPPPVSLESSPSPDRTSDDDSDKPREPSGTYRGRKWPEDDVARLAEARANGEPWETIMQMLPQYSIHALRNKHKRIKQLGWGQHVLRSRSALDVHTTIRSDDTESEPASATRSTKLGRETELRDSQPDRHSSSYKISSTPRPRHGDSDHGSTLQGNEAVLSANVGATKKGGVVKWFDEEIQLLMDLYRQKKSWEEIFEAIPRHTCAAIRTKVSNVRQDVRWAPKAQKGLSYKPSETGIHHAASEAKAHRKRNEALLKAANAGSKVEHQLAQPRQNDGGKRKLPRQDKDFTADSSGRLYSLVIDKFGRKQNLDFLLLPGNYDIAVSEVPGLPWICPIRSCRLAFLKPSSLDIHWTRNHRKCLLNDNNDGTFSIKGEYQPRKVRTANALVTSQNSLDHKEPPMAEARSYRQVQLDKTEKQPTADKQEMHKGISRENGNIGQVDIPDDLTMATNIRAYREWPDDTGALVHTYGALLPVNYRLAKFRGFEWLCPIRTCGRIVPTLKGLGGHFSSGHPGVLLNDNRDGTFTEVGRRNDRSSSADHRAIVVKSKDPLPLDAPPRAEPSASPSNLQAQIDLAASIAEWEKTKPVGYEDKGPTVDELMARRGSSAAKALNKGLRSSELLDTVTPADDLISEPRATSTEDEGAGEAREAVIPESDVETPGPRELMTPIAQENWAIIRKFFSGKELPPPQSGILKELLSQQRLRNIELSPGAQKKPYVQWPKDVSLLIVQLVGREAPTACSRCSKGSGIFSSCVVVSQDVANVLQGGICACVNCSWKSSNHKFCDLRKLLKIVEGASVSNRTSPRKPAVDAADQVVYAGSSNAGGSEIDEPLVHHGSGRLPMSDDSDRGWGSLIRQSRRLTRNATEDRGRTQRTVEHTAATAQGKTTPTAAAARQMTHTTQVDKSFSFRVDVIPSGTRLQLQPDFGNLRICSLVTGKVAVKVCGEQRFDIGFQGMFRLMPGVEAELLNSSGFDAVLQISSFKER